MYSSIIMIDAYGNPPTPGASLVRHLQRARSPSAPPFAIGRVGQADQRRSLQKPGRVGCMS